LGRAGGRRSPSPKQLLTLKDQIPDDARSDLVPSLLDAFSYQGTTWAMPQVLNVQSLYYNKTQMQASGFANPPKTLEDWYTQMTAIRGRLTPFVDSWALDESLASD